MENNAKSEEDYKSIDKYCENVLETYPFDGEIMASQAKAKSECGQKDPHELAHFLPFSEILMHRHVCLSSPPEYIRLPGSSRIILHLKKDYASQMKCLKR